MLISIIISNKLNNCDTLSAMNKKAIHTSHAPDAIGTYSQAIIAPLGQTVYLSGQIPLDPKTMALVGEDVSTQLHQIFKNLQAVCKAAGGSLEHIVKLNIYLTDLTQFPHVNEVMSQYFQKPYPARAAIGVSALPKDAQIEVEGIMVI